jgi:hypothetical protein
VQSKTTARALLTHQFENIIHRDFTVTDNFTYYPHACEYGQIYLQGSSPTGSAA